MLAVFGFAFVYVRFISCKIYDKRDDFDFEIVKLSYLDRDVPRRSSYDTYSVRQSSCHVSDFNS